MSIYTARDGDRIVHAVYAHGEVYTERRGREDVAVCGLEYVLYECKPEDYVTCLPCIATMFTPAWLAQHDPDETMDPRQRRQR